MKKLLGILIVGSSLMVQAAYAKCADSAAYNSCATSCQAGGSKATIESKKTNNVLTFWAHSSANTCEGNKEFTGDGKLNATDAKASWVNLCRSYYCTK